MIHWLYTQILPLLLAFWIFHLAGKVGRLELQVMILEQRADAACLPSYETAIAWNQAKHETCPDVVDVPSSKT